MRDETVRRILIGWLNQEAEERDAEKWVERNDPAGYAYIKLKVSIEELMRKTSEALLVIDRLSAQVSLTDEDIRALSGLVAVTECMAAQDRAV